MTNGDHIQASATTMPTTAPMGVASSTNGSPVKKKLMNWLTRPKVGS